jgi:hypothetical protein
MLLMRPPPTAKLVQPAVGLGMKVAPVNLKKLQSCGAPSKAVMRSVQIALGSLLLPWTEKFDRSQEGH